MQASSRKSGCAPPSIASAPEPTSDRRLMPGTPAAPGRCAYRCYLPVLTGLGARPLRGTRPLAPPHRSRLGRGKTSGWVFNPAIADCGLQGTANSPFSTAETQMQLSTVN